MAAHQTTLPPGSREHEEMHGMGRAGWSNGGSKAFRRCGKGHALGSRLGFSDPWFEITPGRDRKNPDDKIRKDHND